MTQPLFATVKFKKLDPLAKAPSRDRDTDAGNDLSAIDDLVVAPGAIVAVRTGLAISLPAYTYGRVCDRSGMSLKGWRVGAGRVDNNFRGEVKVVLQNTTREPLTIMVGQRVAQLIVVPFYEADFTEVEDLDDTSRGSKGFGSSGL